MSEHAIPVLLNHDHQRVVGKFVAGVLTFLPDHRPTLDQVFAMVGGAGLRVLEQFIEQDENTGASITRIGSVEVLELSIL